MEVQAHTTPETRQALKDYLRNRRLTSSIHLTIATMVLNDFEEALHLLKGIQHPNATWANEVETFLGRCASSHVSHSANLLSELEEGA
jgi:hypothetical protein